jgi:hypothetical protein
MDGSKVPELISQLRWRAGMGAETVLDWLIGMDSLKPIEILVRTAPQVADGSAGSYAGAIEQI